MTSIRGPLARLERSRDELAKAWLVQLIERASLDEIRELPTEQIARELPDLITDIVRAAARADGADSYRLSGEQAQRAVALAELRGGGGEASPTDVARDVASLQRVLVHALREDLGDSDPGRFADAVEGLVDATGAVQAAALESLVERGSRRVEIQAVSDPLTGLGNLRRLQRDIAGLVDLHKRYRHPFAVLLMDIEGLKRINDAHGPAAGDRVLIGVAMSLRRSIRSVDTPIRLGGDEFCVLAPEQDARGAVSLAERLVGAIPIEVAVPGESPVGLSLGVASCPAHGDEAQALIDAADRAMYRAKAAGEPVGLAEPPGA